MKIALVGYGKMGKAIETIVEAQGDQIVARLEEKPTKKNINEADVAIEFSTPQTAFDNVVACLELGIPVVCGTTAWLDRLPEVEKICSHVNGAFIYASNYSLGVNLFFEINKRIAQLMKKYPDYTISLEEIHHTEKKDAPSGTAITLAEEIIPIYHMDGWKLSSDVSSSNQLAIEAKREKDVPGTHTVLYNSEVDQIEIKHIAHSRKGFASGALVAAKWLVGKKGIFTMKDVLGL
ncbi:4-hydroxy-tetrahydrodipicolinate reductase [Apibacter muscae]|uniref:4-hydroxy-tetrahydrodipicolinate reductase n=1 Tax=Apibacter muscae TaxID=2509004 RepID=A0A563D933_9FLAO|nr:4-hydroxy-tetrahydrodipicolinate reductase [Apibacter muscae]TWP26602.1 4-hydroxy-tetrahydrodipicolinate reductase [Apibacter muscae]